MKMIFIHLQESISKNSRLIIMIINKLIFQDSDIK